MKDLRPTALVMLVMFVLLSPGRSLAQDTLRFAWITDLHFGKTDYDGEKLYPGTWLKESLYGISSSGSRFIFLGGDLVDAANNAAQFAMFDSAMKTNLPWYPMSGNHDIGTDPGSIRMDKINAWIARGYGRGPSNREFYGFAVDSLAAFFVLNTQAPISDDPTVLARADQQLAEMDTFFTEHASAPQKFVCSHVPLFIQAWNEADDAYFNITTAYRNRILAVMNKHGVKYYLAGHRHVDGVTSNGGITVYFNTALSFQLGTGNHRGYYVYTVTRGGVTRDFFPPVPDGRFEVRVNVQGSGHVTADPDSLYYSKGSLVHLTAIPDSGWRFQRWSGDLADTDSVATVAMDTTKNILAVFVEQVRSYTLQLRAQQPGGSVSADPVSTKYPEGTNVAVQAVPETGWEFAGWTGALNGTLNPDSVLIAGTREVKAVFHKQGAQLMRLLSVEDSYVRGSLYSSNNFNRDSLLRVREGGADLYRCRSFLRFDLTSVSGTIVNATLLLHSRTANAFPDGTPTNVYAFRSAPDDWTETTLTWKVAPAEGQIVDSTCALAEVNSVYSWDVTAYVIGEIAGDKLLTLVLKDRSMQDKTVDFDSRETAFPPVLEIQTEGSDAVGEDGHMPKTFRLEQNYPNPFNPETSIRFSVAPQVPRDGKASGVNDVKLSVFDLLGRELAVLVNERKAPGSYEVAFDGSRLASGVYVYRLTAGSFVRSKTMCLIK